MKPDREDAHTFQGVHCCVAVRALEPRILLVRISGRDVGELGDRPMLAAERLMPKDDKAHLFIDARDALGPSIEVSAAWAQWLAKHRSGFSCISMLTGSKFVQLTADFVRRWADLNGLMRIYTDATAFETALCIALADRRD
jgi:hypothetical protein